MLTSLHIYHTPPKRDKQAAHHSSPPPIHLLIILLILAAGDIVHPFLVVKVPTDGAFDALLKLQ